MYWDVFGECLNYHQIPHAHKVYFWTTDRFRLIFFKKGAILDLHFGQEGENIFTASSDNTVGMFDFATGQRLKRMKGLTSNALKAFNCLSIVT